MRVLQTTLLTGPYDWDESAIPRREYEPRLSRARDALEAAGAEALLVHGHAGDYGALSYLTAFVPKLDRALALVPQEGPIRLLVAGTELMIPQAKRLTWVEDLRPLANVPKLVADWLGERGGDVATWGFGALPQGMYRGIAKSVEPRRLAALDEPLDAMRRKKSPLERELLRGAARLLAAAADTLVASVRAGAGARSAALAAERAAIGAGAQDARALASLSPGGPPLPTDGPEDRVLDPLIAGIAVQNAGYWAQGYVTVAREPGAALAHAKAGLAAALALARLGVSGAALLEAASARVAPSMPHPATRASIGCAIGLSLEEGPIGALESGGTYALAVGAKGEGSDAAIVSALIAMTEHGPDILWETR
jgi:Xaa-Pro aminopeptidase